MASKLGMLGSVDANTGSPDLGWDTDQFPMDVKNATLIMKVGEDVYIYIYIYTGCSSVTMSTIKVLAITSPEILKGRERGDRVLLYPL